MLSPRHERFGHKSHISGWNWHLPMGNLSMVMSLVFLLDNFTNFSWIWRISFTFFKELEFVDIFSPRECSLRPFSLRKLIRLYRYDFLKKRGTRFDDCKKIQRVLKKPNKLFLWQKVFYSNHHRIEFSFPTAMPTQRLNSITNPQIPLTLYLLILRKYQLFKST